MPPWLVKEVAAPSKLAQDKGNAAEKSFAGADDHRPHQDRTELKQFVSSGKVQAKVPTVLDSSHQSKLDKLKDASGKDFNSDYASDQVNVMPRAATIRT
jgi:putative membrane protein